MIDLSRSSYRPHLVAVIGGIGVIAMQLVFAAATPDTLCGEARALPMSDYQFAASQADLDALFGPAGSACGAELAAAFGRVNLLDALLFIPAFTALMLGFFWGERARLRGVALAGVVLAVIAGGADLVETIVELSQTANARGTVVFSPAAHVATWIKYMSLALAGTAAGLHLLMRAGMIPRLLGTIALLGGLAGIAALAGMSGRGALYGGVAAAWGAMLVYSLLVVIGARRASHASP